jgi:5-methylcytosine-specific restriction protein A
MPSAALRSCSYPGCIALVPSGRCATHRQAEISYHDRESERLYNTQLWRRLRHHQLTIQPWCAECLRTNIYTPATDVDHIQPHRGDPILFFKGPFQSLCHVCHSRKTAGEVLARGGGPKMFSSGELTAGGASNANFFPNVENPG